MDPNEDTQMAEALRWITGVLADCGAGVMIGRIWHGWTRTDDADAYERLLLEEILPGIEGRVGSRGAYLLRRTESEQGDEVEFVTLTLFDTMESARAFSGDGGRGSVVPSAARALLSRFDSEASHFEIVSEPADAS